LRDESYEPNYFIIRQYLSNTNKNTTTTFAKNFRQLNKAESWSAWHTSAAGSCAAFLFGPCQEAERSGHALRAVGSYIKLLIDFCAMLRVYVCTILERKATRPRPSSMHVYIIIVHPLANTIKF